MSGLESKRCRFCGEPATRHISWRTEDGTLASDDDERFPQPYVCDADHHAELHAAMARLKSGAWVEIRPPRPGEVFVPPPGYTKFVPQAAEIPPRPDIE